MMSVVIAGILFVVAGALIMGTRIGRKLETRSGKSPLARKITRNLGEIFFVAGVLCIAAGMANLYYG